MDLDAYVAEHAAQWRRLEALSRRRRLSAEETDELIALYQRVGTHLSVVRSRSPDPALVARLSRILLAARGAITGGTAFSWRTVGRLLGPGDDMLSPPAPAAVITDRYWQQRFGRSPSAIGTTFTARDRTFTIVGVTPPSYEGATQARALRGMGGQAGRDGDGDRLGLGDRRRLA